MSSTTPASPEGDATPPSVKRRPGLTFAVRAACTVAIFAFLLYLLPADELVASMLRTGWPLWTFTVAAHVAIHAVGAMKWRVLLNACGVDAAPLEAVRAYAAGVFANFFLPSIIGGDVVRVGFVARRGTNLTAGVTAGVADRSTDLIALISLAAAGVLLLPEARSGLEIRILSIATLGLLVGLVGATIVVRLVDPEWFPGRIGRLLAAFRSAVDALSARKGAAFLALGGAFLLQGAFVWQNVMIGNAIGIDVPFAAWLFAWPLAKLVSMIPVSLGGLGVREGALAALLVPLAVDPTLSVAQSLVWQTVMFALGIVGGLTAWFLGRRRRSQATET